MPWAYRLRVGRGLGLAAARNCGGLLPSKAAAFAARRMAYGSDGCRRQNPVLATRRFRATSDDPHLIGSRSSAVFDLNAHAFEAWDSEFDVDVDVNVNVNVLGMSRDLEARSLRPTLV